MFETIDQRVAFAQPIAEQYGLESSLLCALFEQESNWETFAIRFEPAFYSRYVLPEHHDPTEAIARSISFGLGQVMGEVAREHGFTGHLASLCDPAIGGDMAARVLAEYITSMHSSVAAGLLRYNGGGNTLYAQQVLDRKEKYDVAQHGSDSSSSPSVP